MLTCQGAVKLFDNFRTKNCRNLQNSHSRKLMPKFSRFDVVTHSFFYCVIQKCNSLPEHAVNQRNSDTFFDLCRKNFSEN